MTPNRVNRTQWPTNENRQNSIFCLSFFGPWKKCLKWHKMGPSFFPTSPGLADILGKTDLDFEILYFWDLLDPRFPDSWILESGSWLWLAAAWGGTSRLISAVPGRHSQRPTSVLKAVLLFMFLENWPWIFWKP